MGGFEQKESCVSFILQLVVLPGPAEAVFPLRLLPILSTAAGQLWLTDQISGGQGGRAAPDWEKNHR